MNARFRKFLLELRTTTQNELNELFGKEVEWIVEELEIRLVVKRSDPDDPESILILGDPISIIHKKVLGTRTDLSDEFERIAAARELGLSQDDAIALVKTIDYLPGFKQKLRDELLSILGLQEG